MNQPVSNETPRMEIILKRLIGVNESTGEIVASISRRAGNILNYPPGLAQELSPNKAEENCILDAIDIQISKYENLNYWLRDINDHLGKII